MDVYAYCLMPNHFHVLGRFRPLSEAVTATIRQEDTAKAQAFLRGEVPVNAFYEDQFKRFFMSYSRASANHTTASAACSGQNSSGA
ncbi:MAG: hypothetical protein OHK0039_39710 [Bacteroidia bacterium]